MTSPVAEQAPTSSPGPSPVAEQREGFGGPEIGLEYRLTVMFDLVLGVGEEEGASRLASP